MPKLLSAFPIAECRSSEDFLTTYRLMNPHIGRVRPLSMGAGAAGTIRLFQLPQAQIIADEPAGLELQGDTPERLFIVLPLGPGVECQGMSITAHEPFIVPRDEFTVRVHGPGDRLYFGLDRAFAEHELMGDDRHRLKEARAGGTPGRRLHLFRSQLLRVISAIDEAPAAVINNQRFRAAQEDLLFLALAQAFTDPESRAPELAIPQAHKRARDYIEAHFRDDIRIIDVAAAVGTSVRSLQAAFRTYEQTTLSRYVHDKRLHFARHRLNAGSPEDTVTSIARDSGFSHLGEFSVHYRALFGESPSETLRLARRDATRSLRGLG
jgi:AraC-like DNA-binding protein